MISRGARLFPDGAAPVHLELVSGFWAAFTAGRLLGAGLSVRVRSDRLATGGLLCGVVCLLAATQPGIAGVAYVAAGLALAPVFPTGVAWLSSALPGVRGATARLWAAHCSVESPCRR